jgi:hypothetical protein
LFPQAKALEELDAEFGVGELVEDEMRNERREAYSSRDLRGLRVEHAVVSVMLRSLFSMACVCLIVLMSGGCS